MLFLFEYNVFIVKSEYVTVASPPLFQSVGNKNGKLWTTDEEVSPEVLAKVRGKQHTQLEII